MAIFVNERSVCLSLFPLFLSCFLIVFRIGVEVQGLIVRIQEVSFRTFAYLFHIFFWFCFVIFVIFLYSQVTFIMSFLNVSFCNLICFHFCIFRLSNLFCLVLCFIIGFSVQAFQILSKTIVCDSIVGKQIGNRTVVLFKQSQKHMLRFYIR